MLKQLKFICMNSLKILTYTITHYFCGCHLFLYWRYIFHVVLGSAPCFFSLFLLRVRERWRSIVISMSVCLSVCGEIWGTTRAIFANFLCMLFISVARSSSGMLTIGRIAYPREWVFFPIDNELYSIAFRTRTTTAKPIDMPFGVTRGLGQMICGGDDPRSGRGNLGKTMCPKT